MFNGGNPYYQSYSYNPYQDHEAAEAHARAQAALAEQRAKRAQWLPEESDAYYDYAQRERAYADAYRDQMFRERDIQRRQQEEAAARQGYGWQHEWERRQYEDDAVRQRERQQQLQQEFLDNPALHQQPSRRGPPIPAPYNVRSTPPPNGYVPAFPQPQTYRKSASPQPYQTSTTPQPQAYQKPTTPQPQSQPAPPAESSADTAPIPQQFRTINSFSEQFDSLCKDFTLPPTIAFQSPSSPNNIINVTATPGPSQLTSDQDGNEPIDVNVPKLAFNSTNYNLHAYMESLDKLLVKLDGVESMGDPEVRTRRREVVKQIEREQARVDRMCKASWARYVADGNRVQ